MAPIDWHKRYEERDTPWDLGSAHPDLAARIARGELRPARGRERALVPGCGRGHDALALARAGYRVTALDLVDATGGALGRELAALDSELLIGDALAHRAAVPYDLVFEHTFFCALDPRLRPAWGELVEHALAPEGRLCALVFPVGKPESEGGPPFGTLTSHLAAVLPKLRLSKDEPVGRSAEKRAWPERWAEFVRA